MRTFYRALNVRISRHLTNMIAGTIATVAAVRVVDVQINLVWLGWILPTLLMVPLIAWWDFRIAMQGSNRAAQT